MPSVEAASALLTAESIVIAAVAVASRQFLGTLEQSGLSGNIMRGLGIAASGFMGISFALSLAYLHAAEFPNAFIAQTISPNLIFNVALLSLLGLLYIGLILILKLYVDIMQDTFGMNFEG